MFLDRPRLRRPISLFGRFAVATVAALLASGCGFAVKTDFPNALRDDRGHMVNFDDVRDILNDPDLSDDEKRDALRELGIDDEKLLDVLLNN